MKLNECVNYVINEFLSELLVKIIFSWNCGDTFTIAHTVIVRHIAIAGHTAVVERIVIAGRIAVVVCEKRCFGVERRNLHHDDSD